MQIVRQTSTTMTLYPQGHLLFDKVEQGTTNTYNVRVEE